MANIASTCCFAPSRPPLRSSRLAPAEEKGLRFQLTPIYGVTIPVIVRLGNLQATAGIANVRLEKKDGGQAVSLDLVRSGSRSTFGEVRVLKAGVKDPSPSRKQSPSIPRSVRVTSRCQ